MLNSGESSKLLIFETHSARNVDFFIPVQDRTAFGRELLSRGIDRLRLKVKWGKVDDDEYVHGAQFENLTEMQREFIFHYLEDHIYGDDQSGSVLVS